MSSISNITSKWQKGFIKPFFVTINNNASSVFKQLQEASKDLVHSTPATSPHEKLSHKMDHIVKKSEIKTAAKKTLDDFEFLKKDDMEPGTDYEKFLKSFSFHMNPVRECYDNHLEKHFKQVLDTQFTQKKQHFLDLLAEFLQLEIPEEYQLFEHEMGLLAVKKETHNKELARLVDESVYLKKLIPKTSSTIHTILNYQGIILFSFSATLLIEAERIMNDPSMAC